MKIEKIIILILTIAFLVSVSLAISQKNRSDLIEKGAGLSKTGACMDGCFDMLELVYGNIDYYNQSQESLHTKCSIKCYDQYFLKDIGENLDEN